MHENHWRAWKTLDLFWFRRCRVGLRVHGEQVSRCCWKFSDTLRTIEQLNRSSSQRKQSWFFFVHKSVPCGMFRLRIQVDFICSHLASARALPGGLFWSNEWSPCFSASYCLVIAGIVTVSSIHQAMQLGFWSSLWKSTLPLRKRQSLLFLISACKKGSFTRTIRGGGILGVEETKAFKH